MNLPPSFGFSSVSSTLAQFNVLHTPTPPPAAAAADPNAAASGGTGTSSAGAVADPATRRRLDGHGQSYAGIFAVNEKDMYILGIVDRTMPADTLYTMRIGGV